MADIEAFLERSPLAERITLPLRVVCGRDHLCLNALAELAKSGVYRLPSKDTEPLTLQAAGTAIATGSLIKKDGHWYFKVLDINDNKEETNR